MFKKRADQKNTRLPKYNRLNRNIKNFKVKTWKTTGSCFRRTQYITSIGLFYKNGGFLLEGCL